MAKVAFIGTGGTMSSIGRGPLDLQDYGVIKTMLPADEILTQVPELHEVAEIVCVPFRAIPSTAMGFPEWKEIAAIIARLEADHPDLDGVVIGHGTATLEETAYALTLGLKTKLPVVVIGSQRPLSGLSTDAKLNLVNGARVAASPASRGRGVLTLLNDEIQAAREVTKTSTFRMQTFRTPDFGVLGQVDGENVRYYRRSERAVAPDTEFDLLALDELPRVDIAYAHIGADGTAIRAYIAAGAAGIVSAGFAPGMSTPDDVTALSEAVTAGIVVVQSTRAGSGHVLDGHRIQELGFLPADNLNPQKARLLLSYALTKTRDPAEIRRIFATY